MSRNVLTDEQLESGRRAWNEIQRKKSQARAGLMRVEHERGLSVVEIARMFGVSRTTVYKALERVESS